MSLHRFFLEASWVAGVLPLTGPDTHHLCSVLRARAGDEIVVVDPDGRQAVAMPEEMNVTVRLPDGLDRQSHQQLGAQP